MKDYVIKYHLYHLFDRAFEDCYCEITVNVPDNWHATAPKLEEVTLKKITLEDDTLNYLRNTYCTNKDEMIARIGEAFNRLDLYEEFIESVSSVWFANGKDDDARFDKWHETATQPETLLAKPVEILKAEALFGSGFNP